ncbi:hypothetical protein DFA_11369 [Cavenderia fasciculata]|uniref:Pleckstrin domain-containing protein n=1 Tax=Cavenderia fasciculata TaxID=261658 RepID=F4QCH3_CACFS|nr:uncharacterized protein DFA_11369 [Cavenderia fasciculata]EGG13608.1 hypothetical protein DFA_11369 [Cavenderia fasciculata]|eukprot:XP_004350312.1 hypothetical protein DFA_11369 [Cavenderia fasciculata]
MVGTAIKEGWLTKQGGIIKSWKNRWFVLYNDNKLSYFKTAYDTVPIDTISLSNMVQIPVIKTVNNAHTIELSVEGRTYFLAAQTLDEATEWLVLFKERTTEVARRNSIISATKREASLGGSGNSLPTTPSKNNSPLNTSSNNVKLNSSSNNTSPILSSSQSLNLDNNNNIKVPEEKVTTLDIKGLMCKHCEDQVIKMMNNARGVNNFQVLADDDRLVVHGTLDVNVNNIITTLESQGFIVSIAT